MPKIYDLNQLKDGVLTFTLNECDVSIANGLRRTIQTDIDTVIFRTTPYEKNDSVFEINTTRFNNEVLKQRLSCVPINITDVNGFPYEQYIMTCHVKNETDIVLYVTTKDFKIKNVLTNEYIDDEQRDKIFPPNSFTSEYIKFCRLRPKVSDEIKGEEIKFTCKFSIGNVKENSMYNAVSLSTYGNTLDLIKINEKWDGMEKEYENDRLTKDDIAFKKRNFMAVDAKRIFIKDSFDFKIKSVGVFENKQIILKACDVLINKFDDLKVKLKEDEIKILPGTIEDEVSYDICLFNEDYTIGKIIESVLHYDYFAKQNIISYVGFKKNHPHDNYSFVRVILREGADLDILKQTLDKIFDKSREFYSEIKEQI